MFSSQVNNALAIIPARYSSTRLPGKPLLEADGKPIIQHVVERVAQAKHINKIVVATDDKRIVEAVEGFGGQAIITKKEHPNGTARIAQALKILETQVNKSQMPIVVNVQGDEPLIEPEVIDALVEELAKKRKCPMATIASPFEKNEDPNDPNIVKVVIDQNSCALYFSRSLIPFDRDNTSICAPLKHAGIYAYRREFLPVYAALKSTALEQAEKLEQLRALSYGYKIMVVQANIKHCGIDTQEQYEDFVQSCINKQEKD